MTQEPKSRRRVRLGKSPAPKERVTPERQALSDARKDRPQRRPEVIEFLRWFPLADARVSKAFQRPDSETPLDSQIWIPLVRADGAFDEDRFIAATQAITLAADPTCNLALVRRQLELAAWGAFLRGEVSRDLPPNFSARRDAAAALLKNLATFLSALRDLDRLGRVTVGVARVAPGLRPRAPIRRPPSGGRQVDLDPKIKCALLRYVQGVPGANVVDLPEVRITFPPVDPPWTPTETAGLAKKLGYGAKGAREPSRVLVADDPFATASDDVRFALAARDVLVGTVVSDTVEALSKLP